MSPMDLPAKTSGCVFASSTVSGSSGHSGVTATKPALSNSLTQLSQLLGSSQRPCTNATGLLPDLLARWTRCASSALMVEVASAVFLELMALSFLATVTGGGHRGGIA